MKKKNQKNLVRIGLIQVRSEATPAANLKKAITQIKIAAAKGAQIVSTQELFTTPYFCQEEKTANFDFAEPIPGPTTDALAKVAKAEKVVIVASLFEKRGKGVYHNTAAVIDAD